MPVYCMSGSVFVPVCIRCIPKNDFVCLLCVDPHKIFWVSAVYPRTVVPTTRSFLSGQDFLSYKKSGLGLVALCLQPPLVTFQLLSVSLQLPSVTLQPPSVTLYPPSVTFQPPSVTPEVPSVGAVQM